MKKRKISEVIQYLKSRVSTLEVLLQHYHVVERDRGWLTTDQQLIYSTYKARLDEIEKLVQYMESGASGASGESGASGASGE